MDLLLISHGQAQKQKGVSSDPDGSLTDFGMKQTCLTGSWLRYNFLHKGFVGYTSPYLRTLQTSSVISEIIDIDFSVDDDLRDFEFFKPKTAIIPNRSLQFDNLSWPIKEWSEESKKFELETIDQFIERCAGFIDKLQDKEDEKVLVVSHNSVCVALAQLAIGKNQEDIRKVCIETQKCLIDHSGKVPSDIYESMVYLGGMKQCGITWIKGEDPCWFSRVVYE
jgi:broad specificity phosphatase PhoE